jgi:AraC-like DNA-binding protein
VGFRDPVPAGRGVDRPSLQCGRCCSTLRNSTSLRRAFRAETGLPLSEWRTRLCLNHSLTLLEQGHMVSAVAAWVGFSTNGYILAFRRYFGQTPGTYVRNWENELT